MTAEPAAHSTEPVDSGYDIQELAYDVLDGLTRPQKELSSRFLYDDRGAGIFEEILELPEYYQGRTEMAILRSQGARIVARCEPTEIIDLGAGSGEKAGQLLAVTDGRAITYSPVDLSSDMLRLCESYFSNGWNHVAVHPILGDVTSLSRVLPPIGDGDRRLIVMFGGTVGNLLLGARRRFLAELADHLGRYGYVLLGLDLLKSPAAIEAAYADSAGVTAEFNRNILMTLNRRLGANFPLEAFDHVIVFDEAKGWVEMRLRARRRCVIDFTALDWSVDIAPGEEIRTEVSAKFSRDGFQREAAWCGLELVDWFTDDQAQFALALLGARS